MRLGFFVFLLVVGKVIFFFFFFALQDGDQFSNNISDMQVMWCEQGRGKSYRRQGNYGKALKNFTAIVKVCPGNKI